MHQTLVAVSEGELLQRLCSESVLLIRREDVLQRMTPDFNLPASHGPRWEALDVEGKGCEPDAQGCLCLLADLSTSLLSSGQVWRMHLEEEAGHHKMTHISIPAAYSSGITLFALQESELGRELLKVPELPLL